MSSPKPKIAVVGSINMDLVVRCDHLPEKGETVIAEQSVELPGGKGANQAVAASRFGGDVSMIGRVGDDSFASRLVDKLKEEKVSVEHVCSTDNCASGIAVVMVENSGENSIVVSPGSNAHVDQSDLKSAIRTLTNSDAVLLQLEVPVETIIQAIQLARESNVLTILDPAPAPKLTPEEFFTVDLLCPNQSEAEAILGYPVGNVEDALRGVHELVERGCKNAVITMGRDGAVVCDGTNTEHISSFEVEAVDTTAAGDAFAGAIAVRWSETDSLFEAIRFACAAGALAASKHGAQSSMPTREDIENLISSKENRSSIGKS